MTVGQKYRVTWTPVIGRTWLTTRVLRLHKWSGALLTFEDETGRRQPIDARTIVKIRRAR